MKSFSSIALLIVTIAIAAAIIVWQLPSLDNGSGNTSAGGGTATGELAGGALELPSDAIRSQVTYVYDGDTLYLQPAGTTTRAEEIKVRLIGIDTPELLPDVECFGTEARDHLRTLVPKGSSVWIASDVDEFDQYGRSLLYVWTEDGTSVNLDLVENGYATALRIAPSDTYWQQFERAQNDARVANAGLWGRC